MLLDFSIDWQWIVGSTDVSPHVETWELTREQPDMGTPAWWRGKLVLRPVVGQSLNLDPLTNSLWRQGTNCSLNVGGSLVFTGSVLLAYYDDWSTTPRLELEVGDVLAAKNHRQVIPFGEYDPLSLLRALGIPGNAPWGDKVEISTDLTSPVKALQELTWVARLKWGLPATLFTRPHGGVDYIGPQAGISLTRTLEQVTDFTRQRPALEIPGSVIASASLTYLIKSPVTQPPSQETGREEDESPDVIVAKSGDVVTLTYLDSFGRVVKEEVYRPVEFTYVVADPYGNVIEERTYTATALSAYTNFEYYVGSEQYSIIKETFALKMIPAGSGRPSVKIPIYEKHERTEERGRKVQQQSSGRFGSEPIFGEVVAEKMTTIYWPGWRFFPNAGAGLYPAYFIREYGFLGRAVISKKQATTSYVLRLTSRALGTTQDADTFIEAISLLPTVTEVLPNQQIQFPDWVRQFWDPPAPEPVEPDEPPNLPVIERVAEALSEEVKVNGFTGPPVYLTVPWLSATVDEQPGSLNLELKIEVLRQNIIYALRAAARWMATEIAGRAFARRITMPVPSEWLARPYPWTLAQIGNEVLWLVGETLRSTSKGVEFEATGILAGRPNTIPPGEFPPGMIPPADLPPGEGQSGLFPPGTIPSFIPLITVAPTLFPKVGIGCEMRVGEAVFIQGDPWLGMAVEIEHAVSAGTSAMVGMAVEIEHAVSAGTSAMVGIGAGETVGSAVGVGWIQILESGIGFSSDATHEITGESGGGDESLTLEAEDGVIVGGVVVYDTDASSCYAVETEDDVYNVYFDADSTSLTWDRPLRLRVVYKATGLGEFLVYLIQGVNSNPLGDWAVDETTGYVGLEIIIPEEEEPFDGIRIDVAEYPGKVRIDAIQLIPDNGEWPPLNPCSN